MCWKETKGFQTYENEEYLDLPVKEEPMSEDEQTSVDLPLECLLCAKNFNSISGLKAHVIAQHSYKSVRRKTSNTPSPVKKTVIKYTCTTCGRHFTTSTDLMVHETCHNKSVCYSCSAKFASFDRLIRHRRYCKASNNVGVTKPKTLEDVIRPPLLTPPVDPPPLVSKPQAQSHMTLKCRKCSETFTDLFYLKIHNEIYHSTQSREETNEHEQNSDLLEKSEHVNDSISSSEQKTGHDRNSDYSEKGEHKNDTSIPKIGLEQNNDPLKKKEHITDPPTLINEHETISQQNNNDFEISDHINELPTSNSEQTNDHLEKSERINDTPSSNSEQEIIPEQTNEKKKHSNEHLISYSEQGTIPERNSDDLEKNEHINDTSKLRSEQETIFEHNDHLAKSEHASGLSTFSDEQKVAHETNSDPEHIENSKKTNENNEPSKVEITFQISNITSIDSDEFNVESTKERGENSEQCNKNVDEVESDHAMVESSNEHEQIESNREVLSDKSDEQENSMNMVNEVKPDNEDSKSDERLGVSADYLRKRNKELHERSLEIQ